jgi:hypothetical protein
MDRLLVTFIGGTLAFVVLAVLGSFWLVSATCHSQARAMRIPSSWGPLQGCIVQYQGTFIPIEAVGVRTIDGPAVVRP